MEYRYQVLSNKERESLNNSFLSLVNLAKDFTLTKMELEKSKALSKNHLSLGYAIQLLFLKNRGFNVGTNEVPADIINFVAEQLGYKGSVFKSYLKSKNVKSAHLQELIMNFGYRKFTVTKEVQRVAYNLSLNTSNSFEIIEAIIKYLKEEKIIMPSLTNLEELVSVALTETDNAIFSEIFKQIEDTILLDKLFLIEKSGTSVFARIKTVSVSNSSRGIHTLLKYIKEIDSFGSQIDLSFLNHNKIECLSQDIIKSDKNKIEKMRDEKKKYSYLSMFLYFKRKEFVDMTIEVSSKFAHKMIKRGKQKNSEYNNKNMENHKLNTEKLKDIVKNILDIEDFDTFRTYKKSLEELKVELDLQEIDLEDLDFIMQLKTNFNYTHSLLNSIEFDSNTKPKLVECLNTFKEFKGKKKMEVEVSVFSKQWQKAVKDSDYNKKTVEIALLYAIRDNIRSGDIFVKKSKKYQSFDNYLVAPSENNLEKSSDTIMTELKKLLKIPENIEFNREIEVDEKSTFSDKVYSLFPKVTMTEIFYEVNGWTRVLEDFRDIDKEDKEKQKPLVATLLAQGHNIGFSKMANSSHLNETNLRRINEVYFTHENLCKAQITLVNYHHSLDIVKNWGSGQSSSSDGMRVPISLKTIYADYNTHYGNKGGAMYRHISDQYMPYYIQMLEARDSIHVPDGLEYHGTDLDIKNHSTDTAGYTEQTFALLYFLGYNFRPRIKSLDQQQLYAFQYKEIGDKKFKKINEKIITENFSEVMRLVKSIEVKKVKPSLILKKIDSYARDNGVAKGLKEIGRVLKTKYILEYYTDGALRKEVQIMLNKGESINSVARAMFFGKHGKLNEARIEDQLSSASCLNLLISSLVIWNSRYLEKVYHLIKDKEWFDEKEFKRVSPLGTQHVSFYGKYIFEEESINTEDGLREINIAE